MIEVKNLTFSYGKDKQALNGLDFTVGDGEIFGFLGPNGSGKSTTQKILTGILKGHGGKVSLFGKDIATAHTQDFFQKIGVLFEFPYLYSNLSAVDNLKYFGVVYIKVVLIIFIAVPLLSYLLGADGLALVFCNLIPSNATFEGIMSLAGGTEQIITKDILILTAHCLVWFLLYLAIAEWKKKNK